MKNQFHYTRGFKPISKNNTLSNIQYFAPPIYRVSRRFKDVLFTDPRWHELQGQTCDNACHSINIVSISEA